MASRLVYVKRGDMEPCPSCGNNAWFRIKSEQVAEDLCEVWAQCDKCGHKPADAEMEDVWGDVGDDNALSALNVWNEQVRLATKAKESDMRNTVEPVHEASKCQRGVKVVFLDGHVSEVREETYSRCLVLAAYQRLRDGASSHRELSVDEEETKAANLAGVLWNRNMQEGERAPQAFFSLEMLEKAAMTPREEAIAETGQCPKCREKLTRTSEGGGARFSQCCRCGDIWVTKA